MGVYDVVMADEKPKVLLDVDGVIIDTNECILDFIHRFTDKRFHASQIKAWDVFEGLGFPELDPLWREACHTEELCYKMKPYVGAPKFLHYLKQMADVVIVTAPLKGCKTWHSQRTDALLHHFGIEANKVIFAGEKHHVHGDFLIDDRLSNVVEWKKYWKCHGDALVFNQSWNQEEGRNFYVSGRVSSYEEILDIVTAWE